MDTNPTDRVVVELDETECLRLAGSEPVGRLVWTGPDGPSIVPVNFTLSDRTVQVRTAAYSEMARECDGSPVAFEVDAYDADNRVGWSVVLAGHARIGVVQTGTPAPDAWPIGAKAVVITLEADRITGRRIRQR